MKKLILLLALFGVLGVSCSKDDDNVNNSQKPNDKPKGTFVTDVEGVYTVDMSGGEVVVTVTSDIEYKVVIPTDAKSWISIAETRADLRIDKIKFIIAPNETFEELKADVNLVANNGYVLQKISFAQQGNTKVFNSDCEESYSIGAVGGKINIKISTNLDYDVVIPNNDKSWISVADTRAAVREETLTLIVAENKITEERSSVVTLYDKDDNILQKINITQSAKSNTIANNEIWYTTTDGKKLFPPTTEPAIFGAFLVSNTYSDGKGVLTFDDDITLIGDSAFSGCTTLATIIIPDSVTTIGDYAFAECSSLTSVTIGDSVTTIGYSAFENCSSLTSVTIPDSVISIGAEAFRNCSSLTSITIPDSVTTIGDYAFLNCSSLTSVTIPDSVTTIGEDAFMWCESLTSVTIPDSVTTIGDSAFYGCSSLTSVTIGDSVTTIGEDAFYNCSSLTSVTIGDSITTIGEYTFYNCSSLTSVYITDLPAWYKIDFGNTAANPLSNGANLYLNDELVTDLVIPSDITEIKPYIFSGCSSLTSVTIPDSVTTIGDYAFSGCSSLISVTIPDSVTIIGTGAFYCCSSLTSVTIGNSVTTIGERAFYGCTGELIVNCNITDAYYFDFEWWNYRSVFYGSEFTSVTIGDSVTTIGDYAFSGCSSLTSVTIPDSVTTIGGSAFYWCQSLTSITIPDSVTSIGNSAFISCSSLTSVTIGDSVTTIGISAFEYCSSLTSVYCKAVTPPAGGSFMFLDNASGRNIYVPMGSVEAYKSAEYWSTYADAIVGYDF